MPSPSIIFRGSSTCSISFAFWCIVHTQTVWVPLPPVKIKCFGPESANFEKAYLVAGMILLNYLKFPLPFLHMPSSTILTDTDRKSFFLASGGLHHHCCRRHALFLLQTHLTSFQVLDLVWPKFHVLSPKLHFSGHSVANFKFLLQFLACLTLS